MNFKIIIFFILAILSTSCLTGCSSDDDIEDIFMGKTWYMSGGKLNGADFTKDQVSSLYVNKDSYWIVFGKGTFSGKLSEGTNFNGRWEANGSSRALKIEISSSLNCEETPLDANIFRVLKNANRYSGDSNILEIFSDDNSYINMGAAK